MPKKKLVSVICTCFNHENFVIEAIESVINQSYKNIELIIIDDCSTDNSSKNILKWINDNQYINFIRNTENIGITKSFNKAFKYAKGDYLIDLAADDKLKPDCVSILIEKFNDSIYNNLGLVYGNAQIIDNKGSFLRNHFPLDHNGELIDKIPTGDVYENIVSNINSLCSVSAMFKRKMFIELNGYDSSLYYEDLDFWIRASRNYNFDFTNKFVVEKRAVTGSLGDYFNKKDKHYKGINNTTHIILNNTLLLNKNKRENLLLSKRVYEMIKRAIRNLDLFYLYRYTMLYIKIIFPAILNKKTS